MSDKAPDALIIPLYAMAYLDDPSSYPGPDDANRAAFARDYSTSEILEIYDAATWAIEHPDHPFRATFAKYLPHLKHDDASIVAYLTKLRDGMRPLVEKLRPPP